MVRHGDLQRRSWGHVRRRQTPARLMGSLRDIDALAPRELERITLAVLSGIGLAIGPGMNRSWVLCLPLMSGLASAEELSERPRVAVWTEPVITSGVPHLIDQGILGLVPLGVTLDTGRGWALNIEGAYASYRDTLISAEPERLGTLYWSAQVSVGVVIPLGKASTPLNGWFAQPKLTGLMARPGGDSKENSSRVEAMLGVDVGWQKTIGHFYFAPLLGVSAGYAVNRGTSVVSGTIDDFGRKDGKAHNGFVMAFNLNLIRMGVVF